MMSWELLGIDISDTSFYIMMLHYIMWFRVVSGCVVVHVRFLCHIVQTLNVMVNFMAIINITIRGALDGLRGCDRHGASEFRLRLRPDPGNFGDDLHKGNPREDHAYDGLDSCGKTGDVRGGHLRLGPGLAGHGDPRQTEDAPHRHHLASDVLSELHGPGKTRPYRVLDLQGHEAHDAVTCSGDGSRSARTPLHRVHRGCKAGVRGFPGGGRDARGTTPTPLPPLDRGRPARVLPGALRFVPPRLRNAGLWAWYVCLGRGVSEALPILGSTA